MKIPKDPFKDLILTREEREIEDNLENWKSVPNLEQEKEKYAQMAKITLDKMRNKKSKFSRSKVELSSTNFHHVLDSV